jgi:ribosomal protein S18 acetylase RimI-like enzyme
MAADIRLARASDVDALLAIENAVFETDRLSRKSFRRLIGSSSAAVSVAEAGGRIAGYSVVLFREGSPTARLYSVAAAPGFSGQGIGRLLISAAERAAAKRGRHSLRLEVREDNARAIAIYRHAGFEPIGREPDYYQDGMAALRLEKHLDDKTSVSLSRSGKETFSAGGSFSLLAEKTPRRASP